MFESPTVLQYASFCSCQRTLCRTYKFCISNREFVLLPLAEWIKLRNTLHYLRSSIIYPVLCDRSSKGPFNRAVTPALNTPLPISKRGQRESLFDLSISPKNTTQCPRSRFKPKPLYPETSTLTAWVQSSSPISQYKAVYKYKYTYITATLTCFFRHLFCCLFIWFLYYWTFDRQPLIIFLYSLSHMCNREMKAWFITYSSTNAMENLTRVFTVLALIATTPPTCLWNSVILPVLWLLGQLAVRYAPQGWHWKSFK